MLNMEEVQATCSKIAITPPRKRLKKSHLSLNEKNIILNVYKTEFFNKPYLVIDEIVQHVANITGVCNSTVYKIIREYKSNAKLFHPKTNPNKKSHVLDYIEEFHKTTIRRKVHEFFFQNELPTIDKVLKVVNEDNDLPNFKRTTFYTLLKSLNFQFIKRGGNSILLDRDDIVLWRRTYLKKIKAFRNEGRKIYYLDETWINAEHAVSKVSIENSVQSSKQALSSGFSSRLKNTSGKEKKLIVCHIGSEDGFVQDSLWSFQSTKSTDYGEEIDKKLFENWFSKTLNKLESNCVIVLDNALYHSRKCESIPISATTKSEIKNWLLSKNIKFDDNMLKAELLNIVKKYINDYDKYAIDEMAKSQGKTILRLPPYHCELNAIELIWAQIKNEVTKNNVTFKFTDVQSLFKESIEAITKENWKKCIQHVLQIEKKMWKLDNLIEVQVETLLM